METNGKSTWFETPAGKHLQESLSDEKTLNGIDRLLMRIDTLEKAVEKLTVVIEQGPGMVSMVTDMADDAYKKAANNGIDIEERLGNALAIAEKLTSPAMVKNLESLFSFANQAPGLISMTMDTADEAIQQSAEKGINIEERLGNALAIAEKITAPEMVEKLDNIFVLAEQAPGLISMMMDSFDEQMGKMNQSGIDVQDMLSLAQDASLSITKAKTMPDAKVGGIFSMLRIMRDPDRQRAIGFLMNIAKAYGQQMKK